IQAPATTSCSTGRRGARSGFLCWIHQKSLEIGSFWGFHGNRTRLQRRQGALSTHQIGVQLTVTPLCDCFRTAPHRTFTARKEQIMQNPVKVVLYEDNRDLREGIAYLLQATPGIELAGAFPHVNNLKSELHTYMPDVVLLDINMPGMSGLEALPII